MTWNSLSSAELEVTKFFLAEQSDGLVYIKAVSMQLFYIEIMKNHLFSIKENEWFF